MNRVLKTIGKVFLALVLVLALLIGASILLGGWDNFKTELERGWQDSQNGIYEPHRPQS